CLRVVSCDGDDRFDDQGVGRPAGPRGRFGFADPAEGNDLPASALEFVLKVRQAVSAERTSVDRTETTSRQPEFTASAPRRRLSVPPAPEAGSPPSRCA